MSRFVAGGCVAALALMWAAAVSAGETLEFGAPAAWVKPATVDPAAATEASAPVAVLNLNHQVLFGADGDTFYSETALKIQTPQGLASARPTMFWNPETDTVTVHKVHILRDGQVIDVLSAGQTFTTMRRESNLEQSMLDGHLTAVLQPEGLKVGDIVTYSMSIHRSNPVLRGKSEALLLNGLELTIGQLTYRAVWPDDKPMRWKVSPDLKEARQTRTADGHELTIDLRGYKRPPAQARVPGRFERFTELQFTELASWNDMSAALAPLYTEASTLAEDSPLKAEAARIRSLSNDPEVQAAAALRLVEEQVRYVYIGANMGNYVPASADVTWSRRFGDCKGKTALLLALLRELGIEADAVAVSNWAGDGMDESLPLIQLFDHVIVRVVINGKTYWMDGTRMGDTRLDLLPVPDHAWGLPLRAGGSDLVPITVPVPEKPLRETRLHLDASAGLDVPAPYRMEVIARGDDAIRFHIAYSMLDETERKTFFEKLGKNDNGNTVDTTTVWRDEATGDVHIVLEGKMKIDWAWPGDGRPRQYTVEGYYIGGGFDLERKDGPNKDAPVSIEFPHYKRTLTTVILPHKGKGFSVLGEAVDKTLAAYAMKRSFSLKDGVFTLDVSEHTVRNEIPVSEVTEAEAELDRLGKTKVILQAPYDYKATDQDVKAAAAGEPKTADDFADRAARYMEGDQYDLAMADYEAALKLDPAAARIYAWRGNARASKEDYDGAMADYDAALKIDPRDITSWYGRALVHFRRDEYPKTIEALTRVLDINPAHPTARQFRSQVFLLEGQKDRALDDALTHAMMQPDTPGSARFVAQTYSALGRWDEAIATLRKALEAEPDDTDLRLHLAALLSACVGLSGEACDEQKRAAVAEYDKVISAAPTGRLYISRAFARPESDRDASFADLDLAVQHNPAMSVNLSRASLYLREDNYEAAMAEINLALAADPEDVGALELRGQVYEKQGDIDAYITNADGILALDPEDSSHLNSACWARASHNRDLEKAMELCEASLKIHPKSGQVLDSRAMIHLQAGRWEQAEADYTAAMKASGQEFGSALYGRGIARLRMGKTEEGQADLAAARFLSSDIDEVYADYGIRP